MRIIVIISILIGFFWKRGSQFQRSKRGEQNPFVNTHTRRNRKKLPEDRAKWKSESDFVQLIGGFRIRILINGEMEDKLKERFFSSYFVLQHEQRSERSISDSVMMAW